MQTSQYYKSIYFSDYKKIYPESKSFTIAFPDNLAMLFRKVEHLSSHQIRNIIGVDNFQRLISIAEKKNVSPNKFCLDTLQSKLDKEKIELDPIHSTFKGGKDLPLQSWYPYLEGYSPDFVRYIIDNFLGKNTKVIYDPFAGTGTTPLVASSLGYLSYYSEINPLLQFLTKIKYQTRNLPKKKLLINKLSNLATTLEKDIPKQIEDKRLLTSYKASFNSSEFFSEKIYSQILKTRSYIDLLKQQNGLSGDILTVAALASLIPCSLLKRQGDLRFKKGPELKGIDEYDFYNTLRLNLLNIIDDIELLKPGLEPILISEDAKSIGKYQNLKIDAVVTSPPYLNGTNYFRNTKVELWFLRYINTPADLNYYRRLAVTAGINDVSLSINKNIKNKMLSNLLNEVEKRAYDRRIPKMIHDYFADMCTVFSDLRKHLKKNSTLAIDLGDSIYSGVHVKTDKILISLMKNLNYNFKESITLRKRISNNGQELKQVLLIFRYKNNNLTKSKIKKPGWEKKWNNFKQKLPHHNQPMSKRNWGDNLHSLCSYQGKLKPSIANLLVDTFVPENGAVLDIFGGVATIPLEAALQNKKSFMFEISPAAYIISKAKLHDIDAIKCKKIISDLDSFIKTESIKKSELNEVKSFGYNKNLQEYFHPRTLVEIILSRHFFNKNKKNIPESYFVQASLMHILHGNRPYALSRRSHGITPYAPTGDYVYKNLIEKLSEKVDRMLKDIEKREQFLEGEVYFQDTTKKWPEKINNLDAIITSPPFFDSTRFYLANWMRLWFAGWEDNHFKTIPGEFVDEIQKKDLTVYDNIFIQARERLNENGVFILHLGKSNKCDMAKELAKRANNWFDVYDIFNESVEHCESHGVKDKGTVTSHQYLVLR